MRRETLSPGRLCGDLGRPSVNPARFCAFALAIALAFASAGCGDTVIDAGKTEDTIRASLEKSLGEAIKTVDCPSSQKVEPGATFTCAVVFPDSGRKTVTLKIRNADADLSVVGLQAGR